MLLGTDLLLGQSLLVWLASNKALDADEAGVGWDRARKMYSQLLRYVEVPAHCPFTFEVKANGYDVVVGCLQEKMKGSSDHAPASTRDLISRLVYFSLTPSLPFPAFVS